MRLFLIFLRIGVMNEFQYRINLAVQLLQSLIAVGTGLVVLALIFQQTTTLSGWTQPELLVVMGVYTIVGGIVGFIIEPNMGQLMQDIRMGTFDYLLTKPADSQLLVSVRQFRLWALTDVVVGCIVGAWGLASMSATVRPVDAVGFVVFLGAGAVLIYCVWLLITTGAFWFVRMEMVQELFQGIYRAGQYPVSIYPTWLRTILTFVLPIGFAVTFPSEALTRRATVTWALVMIGFTVALFVATRLVWRIGTRRYSGASA